MGENLIRRTSVTLGDFLAAYPFQAAAIVIRVFGIFLIIDGASDIIRSNLVKRKADF